MKKIIYIIFLSLIFLTGCTTSNNSVENNESTEVEKLMREQFKIFDSKLFATLEDVIGIQFKNYRFITYNIPKNENMNINSESDSIEITDAVYDNSIFDEIEEPKWEEIKQYIKEINDIIIDIQMDIDKENKEGLINRFNNNIAELTTNVSKENKEQMLIIINNIYEDMFNLYASKITNEEYLNVRKIYYDVILLLIKIEIEDKSGYDKVIEELKEDVKKIKSDNNNYEYIIKRSNIIINAINYNKKVDARIKIAMLVNTIPVLEYNIAY